MTAVENSKRPRPPVLCKGVVYLAPTGRRCMLAPDGLDATTFGLAEATFVYHRADGSPGRNSADEAFTLTAASFHLLRRVA